MNEIAKVKLLSTVVLSAIVAGGVGLYVSRFPSIALVPNVTVAPQLLVAGLGGVGGLLVFRRYLRWKYGSKR